MKRGKQVIEAVAPGARVVIRDAEWLVRRVDTTSTGGQSIHAVGLSELVKDREAVFLAELERDIAVLDPADTTLVQDASPHFRNTLLCIESLLRQTPPTDPPSQERIYLGHKAAMDLVAYQLDPAIQALQQPRQRLLIADAVGPGKTLEAGILLAAALGSADSDYGRLEVETKERSLLYVACTRAKKHALITCYGKPSPFITT